MNFADEKDNELEFGSNKGYCHNKIACMQGKAILNSENESISRYHNTLVGSSGILVAWDVFERHFYDLTSVFTHAHECTLRD